LGELDDVVAEEDNVDVLADANFTYLKVRDTGHYSIRNFKDPTQDAIAKSDSDTH
jgi:hypothetical protein